MILTLEGLKDLQILGLSVFMVTDAGIIELEEFDFSTQEDGQIEIWENHRKPTTISMVFTAYFGINTPNNYKYPDTYRLFGDSESAQDFHSKGLHRRRKLYAEAQRSVLRGDW